MKVIRILLTALLFAGGPFFAPARETLRFSWSSEEEWTGLLRVQDGAAGGEILAGKRASSDRALPLRLIWETPFAVAGSVKPRGLLRFFEMTSLLSRSSLEGTTGYVPDRSALSLKSSGGALFWGDRAGLAVEATRSEFLSGALWGGRRFLSYGRAEGALDVTLPGGEAREESAWYPEEPPGETGALLHGGGDCRWEGIWWTARFRGSFSGGADYLPGSSLLPELTIYRGGLTLFSRFWRNSAGYRSRFFDFPRWNWRWEEEAVYASPLGVWSGAFHLGRPRPEEGESSGLYREGRLSWEHRAAAFRWVLGSTLSLDDREEAALDWESRGRVFWEGPSLRLSLEAEAGMAGPPLAPASRALVLGARRSFAGGLRWGGELRFKEAPEGAEWGGRGELSWRGASWRGRVSAGFTRVLRGEGEAGELVKFTLERVF